MRNLRIAFSNVSTSAHLAGASLAITAITLLAGAAQGFGQQSIFDPDAAFLPAQVWNISTVPSNGDVNPYGVAFVDDDFPVGTGPLQHGDILISNFNKSSNLQGTGTTIVDISKAGGQSACSFRGLRHLD